MHIYYYFKPSIVVNICLYYNQIKINKTPDFIFTGTYIKNVFNKKKNVWSMVMLMKSNFIYV